MMDLAEHHPRTDHCYMPLMSSSLPLDYPSGPDQVIYYLLACVVYAIIDIAVQALGDLLSWRRTLTWR